MTQYIVYQPAPSIDGVSPPDPQVVMAGITEADNASDAIHNLINAGTFPGGSLLNAVDVGKAESFDVSVKATLKAAK